MPTPCQKCNEIFELNDGKESKKWFPNTTICANCREDEEQEMKDEEKVKGWKVIIDGNWCVCWSEEEAGAEIASFLDGLEVGEAVDVSIETVELTRKEVEEMPEFDGW